MGSIAVTRVIASAVLLTCSPPSFAESPPAEEVLKPLTIITSTGSGGTYDVVARLVGKYMAKSLPQQPSVIIQNMPGAGHVLATNYMYNQAPKDGTVIATVGNSVALHQLLNGNGVRYDARQLNWLGSTGISNLVTVAWRGSGVATIQDVMQRDLITGATGTGSGTYLYPLVMNLLLGTKFKLVLGYKSTPEIDLAIERGEVQARSGASLAGLLLEHPSWFADDKVVVLTQVGARREASLPYVPLMSELGRTDEEQILLRLVSSPVAIGRPFLAPPGVRADRVNRLRRAFDAAMSDPAFLEEAAKAKIDLNPVGGEELSQIVETNLAVPSHLVEKVRAALSP